MDVLAEIRRRFHVDKETITSLASTFNLPAPPSVNISKRLNSLFISVKINPTRSWVRFISS